MFGAYLVWFQVFPHRLNGVSALTEQRLKQTFPGLLIFCLRGEQNEDICHTFLSFASHSTSINRGDESKFLPNYGIDTQGRQNPTCSSDALQGTKCQGLNRSCRAAGQSSTALQAQHRQLCSPHPAAAAIPAAHSSSEKGRGWAVLEERPNNQKS